MKPRRYIYEVVKARFSAGNYPGDADDKKAKRKIDKMLRDGFTSFIDLTEDNETNANHKKLNPYAHLLPESVKYAHFPMEELELPEDMRLLLKIVKYIDEQMRRGEKVYLHSRTGYDRTTVVVAAWLINQQRNVSRRRNKRV